MNKRALFPTLGVVCAFTLSLNAFAQSTGTSVDVTKGAPSDAGSSLESGQQNATPAANSAAPAKSPDTSGAEPATSATGAGLAPLPSLLEGPSSQGPSAAPGTGNNPKVLTTPAQKNAAASAATRISPQQPAKREWLKERIEANKAEETPGNSKRPTVAVALGGGGARGAAHIGVLYVLQQEHIPIDYVIGNSMGSIVGGLFAAGVPLPTIERIVEDGGLRHAYFPGWIPPKIIMQPFMKMAEAFTHKRQYAGLFASDKFKNFLAQYMPKGANTTFKDTKIPFSAVATNLVDGKAYTLNDGNLPEAIAASAAISPMIKPVEIGDKLYVDGGVRANLPASAAKDIGAKVVIGVIVDEPIQKQSKDKFRKLKNIALRMSDIVLAVNDEKQLPFADIVINPDVTGIKTLSKNGEDARKAIIAGIKAAMKALPDIRKKLQMQEAQVAEQKSGDKSNNL